MKLDTALYRINKAAKNYYMTAKTLEKYKEEKRIPDDMLPEKKEIVMKIAKEEGLDLNTFSESRVIDDVIRNLIKRGDELYTLKHEVCDMYEYIPLRYVEIGKKRYKEIRIEGYNLHIPISTFEEKLISSGDIELEYPKKSHRSFCIYISASELKEAIDYFNVRIFQHRAENSDSNTKE